MTVVRQNSYRLCSASRFENSIELNGEECIWRSMKRPLGRAALLSQAPPQEVNPLGCLVRATRMEYKPRGGPMACLRRGRVGAALSALAKLSLAALGSMGPISR